MACICAGPAAASPTPIIPAPVKAEAHDGQFQLTAASRLLASPALANEARLLAARLRRATGYPLKIKTANSPPGRRRHLADHQWRRRRARPGGL